MKLKYKLFINFACLFFIAINIFGYLLIKYTFNNRLNKTIDSSIKEYSIVYSNIKDAKNYNNIFVNDRDILKLKSNDYLSNVQNSRIILEFRSLDKNLIYSSKDMDLYYPKELFKFNESDNDEINYIFYTDHDENKYIILNKLIQFKSSEIFFIYASDITELWSDYHKNYLILLGFNIVFGVLLLIIIFIISTEITYPINQLIDNINEIIKENYSTNLNYHSDIVELNIICEKFTNMNNEIKNKFKLLEQQNDSKQRFIENITHEIRTPLTSIIGYSSLILEKDISDVDIMKNSLKKIYAEGKRIEGLATNLIKIITIDKNSLVITQINICSVLKEIESIFKIRLFENNITLNISGDDFYINIDKELFIILITNFFDNAIKAVLPCEIKEISFIMEKNKLTIKDTGIGICAEDLNKIFEPFYMIDKSRKKSINGFGLGLSICEKLIKLFNIKFDIKSELNKGTDVILIFPEEEN